VVALLAADVVDDVAVADIVVVVVVVARVCCIPADGHTVVESQENYAHDRHTDSGDFPFVHPN